MTQITTGPDGQPLFDGMTVKQIADVLTIVDTMPGTSSILSAAAAALRHLSAQRPAPAVDGEL